MKQLGAGRSGFYAPQNELTKENKITIYAHCHYHTHSTDCISILTLVQHLYTKFAVHLSWQRCARVFCRYLVCSWPLKTVFGVLVNCWR